MGEPSDALVLRSEADAFKLIEQYLSGNMPNSSELQLDGWPTITIRMQGEGFDSTITPSVMKGFISLQGALYRSFAAARYNDPGKRLTAAEREALEIRVKVEKGSSEYEINLQEIILTLIKEVGGRMNPDHALITVVAIALLLVGRSVISSYLEHRRDIREKEVKSEVEREQLRNFRVMSEQETERMRIMSRLIATDHRIDNISRIAHDAQTDLVKSVSSADTAELDGIRLTGELAQIITQNARQRSTEVRLDGIYRITRLDWSDPVAFKVRVWNTETGAEVDATVQDVSLNTNNKKALQDAEWARLPVRLKINAKMLRDSIREAKIIDVESLPEK